MMPSPSVPRLRAESLRPARGRRGRSDCRAWPPSTAGIARRRGRGGSEGASRCCCRRKESRRRRWRHRRRRRQEHRSSCSCPSSSAGASSPHQSSCLSLSELFQALKETKSNPPFPRKGLRRSCFFSPLKKIVECEREEKNQKTLCSPVLPVLFSFSAFFFTAFSPVLFSFLRSLSFFNKLFVSVWPRLFASSLLNK